MFGSPMLDIAIGMSFVYLLLSLVCSAASEGIESVLKKRATDLERGIRELLDDRDGTGLARSLYRHQLIYGLFRGDYKKGGGQLPSYIPARSFALALMDIVLPAQAETTSGAAGATPPVSAASAVPASSLPVAAPPPTAPRNPLHPLRTAAAGLPSKGVSQALLTLIDAAGTDTNRARENIEAWYNSSMDRVTGWYKRRAQWIIFLCGALFAVVLNVDSVRIVQVLSVDRQLRENIATNAAEYLRANPDSPASVAPAVSPPGPPRSTTPKISATPPAGGGAARTAPGRTKAQPGAPGTVTAASAPTAAGQPTESPGPEKSKTDARSAKPDTNKSKTCQENPRGPICRYETTLVELGNLGLPTVGLPIGWSTEELPLAPWENLSHSVLRAWELLQRHFFGWLITALAASLGAPFWFDLLNKFVAIRGAAKPQPTLAADAGKS